jgi:hypothetical protein
MNLPITMWFQYTFDGKGHIDPAFGEATIDGRPSGLIQASGSYSIDSAGAAALSSTICMSWPVLKLFRLSFKLWLDYLTGVLVLLC